MPSGQRKQVIDIYYNNAQVHDLLFDRFLLSFRHEIEVSFPGECPLAGGGRVIPACAERGDIDRNRNRKAG